MKKWILLAFCVGLVTGCTSCSSNKPTLKGLLNEMSGNCGANGTSVQKAKPSDEPNDELKAEVEVHCYPPPYRTGY